MLTWLAANAATIMICVILAVIVVAIIMKLIRDKRAGKSSCGCGCANCGMQGMCHEQKKQ